MEPIDEDQRNRYFTELAIALKRERLETMPPENGLLQVLLEGRPLCRISGGGGVRYRPEDMASEPLEHALQKATDIAETVSEHMRLMESAPILKADGLDESYRLLADFNGYVLAGHIFHNSYGVQFVTWQWSYGKMGVPLGHYAHDYEDAKKDFVLRAGLVDRQHFFSNEQLTELYRCASNELYNNFNLTYEQEKSIENIRVQIRSLVPDLNERFSNPQTVSPQTEQTI